MYVAKSEIPDTSGCPKKIRFRCIPKKNTSELQKIRQFRCIHPSKSIKISNPRCHILSSEANLRANQSEIHRNSKKSGNPDVSILPKPPQSNKISNPRCHIIPSEANLRANHSEPRLRGSRLRGKVGIFAGN